MGTDTQTQPAAETTDDFTPVVFHSGASNYTIVRKPERRRQLGESNEFEAVAGQRYEFVDGVYAAKTQDDVDWLRAQSDSYGTFYWEPESANAPRVADSSGLQAEIMKAALAGDRDTISDILIAERSGESRPAVLVACETALIQMGQELPAKPDSPLHEAQRVRMGPTAGVTPGVSPDPVPGTPTVDPSTLTETPVASSTPPPEQPQASETMPGAQGPTGNEGDSTAQATAEAPPEVQTPPSVVETPPAEAAPGDAGTTPDPANGDQGAPGAPAPADGGGQA